MHIAPNTGPAGNSAAPAPSTASGSGSNSRASLLELLQSLLHADLVWFLGEQRLEIWTWVQGIDLGCDCRQQEGGMQRVREGGRQRREGCSMVWFLLWAAGPLSCQPLRDGVNPCGDSPLKLGGLGDSPGSSFPPLAESFPWSRDELRGPWERAQGRRETPGALEEGSLSTGAIPAVAAESPGRPGLCGRGRERHLLSTSASV